MQVPVLLKMLQKATTMFLFSFVVRPIVCLLVDAKIWHLTLLNVMSISSFFAVASMFSTTRSVRNLLSNKGLCKKVNKNVHVILSQNSKASVNLLSKDATSQCSFSEVGTSIELD